MSENIAAAAGSRNAAGSTDGVSASVELDAEGVVTAWSTAACDLLGYEQGEAVGRQAAELLAEAVSGDARFHWGERTPFSGRFVVRCGNGHRLPVWAVVHPHGDDAEDVRWLVTFRGLGPPARTGTADEGAPEMAELKQWALDQMPLPMSLFDRRGLRVAVNAAMERVMGPEPLPLGLRMGEYEPGVRVAGTEGFDEAAQRVLRSGREETIEGYLRTPGEDRTHAWLSALYPVVDPVGRVWGVSLAAIDVTDQFRARQRLSVLNDAGARIGTTLDLERTADELAQVAAEHFADFAVVDLLDSVLQGEGTVAHSGESAFRRTAQRSVLPGCPESVVPLGSRHTFHEDSPPGLALAAGHGLKDLIDENALASWAAGSAERARSIREHHIHSLMAVPLRARGVTQGIAIFGRHRTPDPFDEEDLQLAEELATRAAVYIENARRYTRERAIALALQRSLLPHRAPRRTAAAVDMASRYLPADPDVGIGGDWFDVIPLSGARVALVVGDVVGHGIQASATMGRLCTAVRTLADMDVPPDELLTQLDDLVLRLDREATDGDSGQAEEGPAEVGATCLYAVYDPVSRRCSMARAGHPTPLLATPDGSVDSLEVPAGPPLGVGGLPFEVAEFELPEGSVLALYTDGLVEGTDRGADDLRAALRDVCRQQSLDAFCDRLVHRLLPGHRTDDAALLLARTQALDAAEVATWELPDDPAAVAHSRELVRDKLAAWGLEHAAFTTELVVSELVTNAIRYGRPPVVLRLIHESELICEVTDASSAAPHLRRARLFDEGGRGLFIVAQLAQRWGTRHTRTGKTIWAELPLPASTADGADQ
ncbi:SpoIIE family protein phosphatase [Streptomyces sp. NPDC002917]|uniref:ATP-binding SpoIIE family protein phosphatase n=1 Tax=Streptomyces sp. NPDC002917 TaxID=3364671 RepID=UPI00367DCDAF